MARETAAQRREREESEREARYLASRVPATIADVRNIQVMVRHAHRNLADDRAHLIENMRWLSRSLAQDADRLEQHPDYEASDSVISGSLVHDIAREANVLTARGRLLTSMVKDLVREGVPFPGIEVTD